jgi:hypothetical protein
MAAAHRPLAVLLVMFSLGTGAVFADDASAAPAAPAADTFKFGMSLGLGVQTFAEPDSYNGTPTTTYQSLSLTPDFSFGKFGIGLDITLNYRFAGSGNTFVVRQQDWVPTSLQNFFEIYLPKIAYVRYGVKGDPLYVKLGSFIDATLGDGFIMGSYANTLFLPTARHFGLIADLDGSLFDFPYLGVESVMGNVAVLDVMGGRVFVRPLAGTDIPIWNRLEVGLTGVVDTQPYFGMDPVLFTGSPSPVSAFGADVRVPLVYTKDVFSLIAFTDAATLNLKSWGYMIGAGGRIINVITYGAQIRLLGAGFTPDYFGPTYDLLRGFQYNTLQAGGSGSTFGWLASLGTSVLNDLLIFTLTLDGPFVTTETDPLLKYPHLAGILTLGEGLVPGISFNFSYDKKAIAYFSDLVSAQDAAINAMVNFRTGPAVISFYYNIVYMENPVPPQTNHWTVTSGLLTKVALF